MTWFERIKNDFQPIGNMKYYIPLDMEINHVDCRYYSMDRRCIILSRDDIRGLFDPVIHRITNLIDAQLKAAGKEYVIH